jgi:hypothetical protein
MAPRALEPEWLDALEPEDPRAIRSRRDLRVINGWMRQPAIMARVLARSCAPARSCASEGPRRLIDLGSGDGTFLLRVARRLRWRRVTALLVDQRDSVTPATRAAFAALGWRAESLAADAREVLAQGVPVDVITANLFLHHLATEDLRALFADAARSTALFVACEPRRNAFSYAASRMVWALGCNHVSRHDAAVSVRAGFTDRELSALWPDAAAWHVEEFAALPFTHCFVARREAVP